jgi:hypothetical protein
VNKLHATNGFIGVVSRRRLPIALQSASGNASYKRGKLVDPVSMAVGHWLTYQQAEVEHRNCRQPLTVTQQAADSQATGYPPPSPILQTT